MPTRTTTTYSLRTPMTLGNLRDFVAATSHLPDDKSVTVIHDRGASGAGAQFDPPSTSLSVADV